MMMQMFVRHESVCQHQPIRFERSTKENRITLGTILSMLFNMNEQNVISMEVCEYATLSHGSDKNIITIKNQKSIWNFVSWS